jgi:hypothetical protein
MNKATIDTMKSKGKWHPENDLKWLSRASIEEVERREENARNCEFCRLDKLYDEGKIDFENPPEMWLMTFQRWMLKRFGLANLVSYLKTHEYKNRYELISERLKAIGGLSDTEIEAALKEPIKINKSSVCRIANKIPRSVSRKEAFQAAWKIVKNGGYEIKVAGVSFYNRQEALRRLAAYDPKDVHAFLVPEFDNPYDANAIAVKVLVDGSRNVYRIG